MATTELELTETQNEANYKRAQRDLLIRVSAVSGYANRLGKVISAHAILLVRQIRDSQSWKYADVEYTGLKEYLDRDPNSPMTYHEFNSRTNLLDSMGEDAFDFLSAIGLKPGAQEKLVGRIRTEGDEYVITRADGGEERFSKTDAAAAKRLLPEIIAEYRELEREKQQADKVLDEQAKKLEQGQADYDKLKAELIDAQKAHGLNVTDTDEDVTEFLAMIEVARRAKSRFASMDPKKKRALKQRILETLGQVQLDFADAFDLGAPEEASADSKSSEPLDE